MGINQLKLAIMERVLQIEDAALLAAVLKILSHKDDAPVDLRTRPVSSPSTQSPFNQTTDLESTKALEEDAQDLQQSIDEIFGA